MSSSIETVKLYLELPRLLPPLPVFIIYWPHFVGSVQSAIANAASPQALVNANFLLLIGSFFLSNGLHIWNDLIDAPIDRQVERTRLRPIARGAVTPAAALIYMASQAIFGFVTLLYLPPQSFLCGLSSIGLWTFYPFAKRVTNYPQVVLGLAMSWGIFIGAIATGSDPFWTNLGSSEKTSTICQFGAGVLWTVTYDTIYAHQDIKDDMRVGVKSMAVAFRGHAKTLLWTLFGCILLLQLASGILSGYSSAYFVSTIGFTAAAIGIEIASVDLQRPESCKWWFSNGFWPGSVAMVSGLLLEYVSAAQW